MASAYNRPTWLKRQPVLAERPVVSDGFIVLRHCPPWQLPDLELGGGYPSTSPKI